MSRSQWEINSPEGAFHGKHSHPHSYSICVDSDAQHKCIALVFGETDDEAAERAKLIVSLESQLTQARSELAAVKSHIGHTQTKYVPINGGKDCGCKFCRTFTELQAEVARLSAELAKCGKENCMGHRIDGMANWVREERLVEAKAELGKAQEKVSRQRADLARCYQEIASLKSHLAFHHGAKEEIKRLTHILQSKDTK